MNKRGFTLIEVLVSLALMAIIMILVVPQISNYNKKIRKEAYDTKIQDVIISSKDWGNDNINLLSQDCYNITIGNLIVSGYLIGDSNNKKELINPISNESMNNISICIKYLYDSESKVYSVESIINE